MAHGHGLKRPHTVIALCPYQVCGKPRQILSTQSDRRPTARSSASRPKQGQPGSLPLGLPGGVLTAIHQGHTHQVSPGGALKPKVPGSGAEMGDGSMANPKAVPSKEILLKNTLRSILSTLYPLSEVGGFRVRNIFQLLTLTIWTLV